MKLRIVIEPDEDVYVAYCPELPGCVTYGKTEEEARANISVFLKRRWRKITVNSKELTLCCMVVDPLRLAPMDNFIVNLNSHLL